MVSGTDEWAKWSERGRSWRQEQVAWPWYSREEEVAEKGLAHAKAAFSLVAARSVFRWGVLSFSNCVQLFPLGKLLPASGNILVYYSVIFRLRHQRWGRRCVCRVSFAQSQSHSGAASCADPLWAVDWAAALEKHHVFLSVAATGVVRMGASPGGDVSESFHKSQDLVLLLHTISD